MKGAGEIFLTRMMSLEILLASLIVSWSNYGLANSLECAPNPSDANYKPFPSLPIQFESKVEVNIDENRTTIEVEDFYDGMKKQGAVKFMKNGVSAMNVFIYDLKWSIRISGDKCKVYYNQSTDAVKHARCYESSDYGIGVACGVSEILFAPSRAGKDARYVGVRMTERGIPCDQWRVCIPAADPKDSLIFDYWFSVPGWISATGKEEIPIMATVQTNMTKGAGSLYHVYNFIDFKAKEPYVNIPTDIVCPGVNDPPEQPTLPKRFEVGFETTDRKNLTLEETKEYYDMENGLHRVDFISHNEDVPFTGVGLTSDIHHLKKGISYRINRKKGTCTQFKPQQEVTLIQSGDHFHLRTTTGVLSLFPSPDNMYHGFSNIRDIDADNWRLVRKDYPPGMLGNSTWSWYFSKSDWKTNINQQVPVHLFVSGAVGKSNTSKPMDLDMHINFFGFNTEFLSTKTFDLPDSCYDVPPVPKKQYDGTIVAVVGVTCGLAGMAIGCLALFCFFKRAQGRDGPYSMMRM